MRTRRKLQTSISFHEAISHNKVSVPKRNISKLLLSGLNISRRVVNNQILIKLYLSHWVKTRSVSMPTLTSWRLRKTLHSAQPIMNWLLQARPISVAVVAQSGLCFEKRRIDSGNVRWLWRHTSFCVSVGWEVGNWIWNVRNRRGCL